ncbi:MAG: ChbG/HpnK family deacetylase [Pseudomonadota bacterium]
MTNQKFQIIADDFAMSKGVSVAILELCNQKLLSGVSIMPTAGFYQDYLEELKQQKVNNIKFGLHLDLTFGQAQYQNRNQLIVDEKGVFKNSFFKIFLLSFIKRKALVRVFYREINQQLKILTKDLGKLDYIDGHQHIHTVPLVFKITQKLAKKYQIPRLRIINESFFSSVNLHNFPSPIAIIKFLVLKFCYLFNRAKTDFYFFSILYSCKIDQKAVAKIARLKKDNLEIMVHPGYSNIDRDDISNREYSHLTSQYRDIERQQIIALAELAR